MHLLCDQFSSRASRSGGRNGRRAFTLVELLIVIGIIAILIAILLPTLNAANRAAKLTKCLSNMRNMAVAHCIYVNDNRGYIIQAGFGHGGTTHDEQGAWFYTLQRYYTAPLLLRCPADDSPHWEEAGTPVPPTTLASPRWRRTSYGINNFLDVATCPTTGVFSGGPYRKITDIRRSSATVHFIEMAETGEYAGSDHPHIENWHLVVAPQFSPLLAGDQMELHQHGGQRKTWQGKANYAFLDGHAATHAYSEVFTNFQKNQFDPARAQ